MIRDAAGKYWMLYHAVDTGRSRAKPGDEINSRRVMLLDRIEIVGGWPRIAGGEPSTGAQAAPVVSPRDR